ncbi:MAG: response regulator transcription factor [Actinobacteria bacterium]|nr:response regulator transcription factor [Actinomycetota bacterium]
MAGQSGAAMQPSRAQHDNRAYAPSVVSHARFSDTPGQQLPGRRQLGPSHDLHARHAVVWDRDPRTAMRIGNALRRQAHTVHVVHEPAALHRCLRHDDPDVVIVHLDEIAAVPAEVFDTTAPPIVGFTTATDPMARARFLDLGVDDVVPAPLSIPELEARVRAVLSRTRDDGASVPDTLSCGSLELDMSTSRVRVRGGWVDLTALELKLLSFLMQHPARAFSRETLLEKVWGFSLGDTSTVSVHIRRLRLKLEEEPARPVIIRTVWGVGYYLEPPTE